MRYIVLIIFSVMLSFGIFLRLAYGQVLDDRIKAPEFRLSPVNVQTVQDCIIGKALEDKEFTVILFWTTWCPHCARAIVDVNDYNSQYGNKVKFCGVALEQDVGKVRNYLKARGITFPVGIDRDGVIGYMYGIRGVPTIVVIDKDGYVFDYGFSIRGIMNRIISKLGQTKNN